MKVYTFTNYLFEYIWLDSDNDFRSKTKIIHRDELTENQRYELDELSEQSRTTVSSLLPEWNYDGSSTGQSTTESSEIILKPCCVFRDPFRIETNPNSFLVWCQTYDRNGVALQNSHRDMALNMFVKYFESEPWFGLEQEYFIIKPKITHNSVFNMPLGFEVFNDVVIEPPSQGKYYCGVGSETVYGREVAEAHMSNCLLAGVKICGINAEVGPAQWEYQIGICNGIQAADHLWVSRYILVRTAETFNMRINFHPKPLGEDADWNGSGCHTNFSTKEMREEGGFNKIVEAINNLSHHHEEDILYFGKYNDQRLSGKHETSNYDTFCYGIASRNTSVRIPHQVAIDNKGYFEDRRPAANCDPYLVTALIMKSCLGE